MELLPGRVVLRDLAEGSWWIQPRSGKQVSGVVEVEIRPSETVEVETTLLEGAWVRIDLLDFDRQPREPIHVAATAGAQRSTFLVPPEQAIAAFYAHLPWEFVVQASTPSGVVRVVRRTSGRHVRIESDRASLGTAASPTTSWCRVRWGKRGARPFFAEEVKRVFRRFRASADAVQGTHRGRSRTTDSER